MAGVGGSGGLRQQNSPSGTKSDFNSVRKNNRGAGLRHLGRSPFGSVIATTVRMMVCAT